MLVAHHDLQAKKLPKSKTPVNADKYTTRMLLKRVHTTTDVADAKDFTTAIVKLYKGNGLYPLSAIKKLATFPDTFDLAVDQLFEAFSKASSPANYMDHMKYWRSIRKPQGAFGRYIKNFDQALAWMICSHWLHLLKEGRDLDWLPMYLDDRIRKVWSALLGASSPPFKYRDVLTKKDPSIFSTALGLLKFCQTRCAVGIKVMRVAGHRLPPELVNAIKEMAIGRGEFLNMVKLMLNAGDQGCARMLVFPPGVPPLGFSRMLRTPRWADPLKEFLELCPTVGN
ncbi:hypothetical protein CLAFUW4_03551 [Fulvia fulva]|nr:hypothetical protein CLAFUR4_03540 [Fulvia fulva]KAK4633614.1 hypothetical protein CLAFUR0_03545 [Fulvia fulva]WPV10705.1 hypothetical protein CLAFUW4_03551 [Fulvia fulva]WPV26111.1 hypothetical protein CLAFUW7_03543 [Fulvia fulva]